MRTPTLGNATPAALTLLAMASHAAAMQGAGPLWSEGFEQGAAAWEGLGTRSSEYDAPVEGVSYGLLAAGSAPAFTVTPVLIEAGRRYTLTLWARTAYSDAHLAALRGGPETLPLGAAVEAFAEGALFAGDEVFAEAAALVSPTPVLGAPEDETNDDGANVWIDEDAGFRHAFAENRFYQPLSSDPIAGVWFQGPMPLAFDEDDMMAKSAAIFPDGTRRLYGFNSDNPFCSGTGEDCQAILFADITGSGDPDYATPGTPDARYVVWHAGDEDPWLGDPHVFVDEADGRVWLTFGGGTGVYVAELDSATGYVMGFDAPIGFDAHPEAFTKVADWEGDEWTDDSAWFEGASLWREGDGWYLFTTNGSLALNYTIRVGRGDAPTGPFLDKRGRDMNAFDGADNEFGNSFVLGDDADQLLPGHPHVWREGDARYLGYDYRRGKPGQPDSAFDAMGIRRVRWVDGWPTVWHPVTLSFDADDHPQRIGQPIGVALAAFGDEGAIVAFDRLQITSAPSPDGTRVGLLGDSITEGVFGTTYASFLADRLGPGFNVLEWEGRKGHGVSGATLVQDSGLPIWETGAYADLLASRPDIVTVMLGSNDVSPELAPALFANYEADLRLLIATLRGLDSAPEVILCTPPPQGSLSAEGDRRIRETVIPIIDHVGSELGLRVVDVYARVIDYPANWPDALHPDAAGNANLAEIFLGGITRPRCAAGWAPPADLADFFDTAAFFRRAALGEPAADLAPPYASIDGADRGAYFDALTLPCP